VHDPNDMGSTSRNRPSLRAGSIAIPRFELLSGMSVPPTQSVRPAVSILDVLSGIEQTTADLRDANGKLDADRVREAFGFSSVDELARRAGIRMPTLGRKGSAPALTLALETLEKIARIRVLKQLREPQTFQSWWHRKIPSLGDRSPYDTWLAGNGQTVVELVDRVLVGDTCG